MGHIKNIYETQEHQAGCFFNVEKEGVKKNGNNKRITDGRYKRTDSLC